MALDFTQFAVAGSLAMMQRPTNLQIDAPPDVPEIAIQQGEPAREPLSSRLVRCRDLVELYYGKRATMTLVESNPTAAGGVFQVVPPNPSRIRIEITVANISGANNLAVRLGSQIAVQAGGGLKLAFPNDSTFYIVRDFRTDGDAVCREIWANAPTLTTNISVRETLLTPLPVDES